MFSPPNLQYAYGTEHNNIYYDSLASVAVSQLYSNEHHEQICALLGNKFILQISCVSSSEELSNRTRFRNYFQLLPTDSDLANGFFGIITRFKWNRVAIILQEERLFEVASVPARVDIHYIIIKLLATQDVCLD